MTPEQRERASAWATVAIEELLNDGAVPVIIVSGLLDADGQLFGPGPVATIPSLDVSAIHDILEVAFKQVASNDVEKITRPWPGRST